MGRLAVELSVALTVIIVLLYLLAYAYNRSEWLRRVLSCARRLRSGGKADP